MAVATSVSVTEPGVFDSSKLLTRSLVERTVAGHLLQQLAAQFLCHRVGLRVPRGIGFPLQLAGISRAVGAAADGTGNAVLLCRGDVAVCDARVRQGIYQLSAEHRFRERRMTSATYPPYIRVSNCRPAVVSVQRTMRSCARPVRPWASVWAVVTHRLEGGDEVRAAHGQITRPHGRRVQLAPQPLAEIRRAFHALCVVQHPQLLPARQAGFITRQQNFLWRPVPCKARRVALRRGAPGDYPGITAGDAVTVFGSSIALLL